ncbi:MAG: DNA-3-methyladenine glycosylase [Patescibacteria group bacterium]|nr:DNA-3-methyladenine glycosylase [Patescibacteria group bacterium]
MKKLLTENFFGSKNTAKIARDLLGKFLIRKTGKETVVYMITETEAYDGFSDKASHAHRGITERNKIMFGEAGRWYVYFTYGMHFMLNIVTGPTDYPAAVLIRGIEGTNGPARLTKKLKIDKKLNGAPATRKSGLWIEDRGIKIRSKQIKTASRVGVDYAGPVWSKKKLRFFIV